MKMTNPPLSESTMQKCEQVRERLRVAGSVLIALSGGVDSSLLAVLAREELKDAVLAVTLTGEMLPPWEIEIAEAVARQFGIRHEVRSVNPLSVEAVAKNEPDRCYHCKRFLFETLLTMAKEKGLAVVCDGTNADDAADYRPGRKALAELGILSPFLDAGMTKADIRACARARGLANWNAPSCACFASRIPYHERLTPEILLQVAKAETVLRAMGFEGVRVRWHGDVARIEVAPDAFDKAIALRENITKACVEAGFHYVALDLVGFRSGSMNETIGKTNDE